MCDERDVLISKVSHANEQLAALQVGIGIESFISSTRTVRSGLLVFG